MRAVVVYESHWGNTEAVARAIADGLGPDAVALTTDQAGAAVIAGVDLIVAGAPVMGFRLPTEGMIEGLRTERGADTSNAPMRAWLEGLPDGSGAYAAFETRIWWSPGGATGAIGRALEAAGYRPIAKGHRFIVKDKDGPLREGELENARQWGAELAAAMRRPEEPALVG
jgi:flavodoxin